MNRRRLNKEKYIATVYRYCNVTIFNKTEKLTKLKPKMKNTHFTGNSFSQHFFTIVLKN